MLSCPMVCEPLGNYSHILLLLFSHYFFLLWSSRNTRLKHYLLDTLTVLTLFLLQLTKQRTVHIVSVKQRLR